MVPLIRLSSSVSVSPWNAAGSTFCGAIAQQFLDSGRLAFSQARGSHLLPCGSALSPGKHEVCVTSAGNHFVKGRSCNNLLQSNSEVLVGRDPMLLPHSCLKHIFSKHGLRFLPASCYLKHMVSRSDSSSRAWGGPERCRCAKNLLISERDNTERMTTKFGTEFRRMVENVTDLCFTGLPFMSTGIVE